MARWFAVCSKCGYRVEGDLSEGKCPQCGAASWLCRLLDLPVRPRSMPSSFAEVDAVTGSNLCNKIQASIRRGVGRPHADISAPEVMRLHEDGMTLRKIATKMGVSHMTVKRILSGV
jgi:hypothetical protein